VLLQLVPLPPALLRIVSPGSAAFHERLAIVSGGEWRPVSVSPPDTLRGLLFLAGMSLLYAAVFRLFRDGSQRRRLATAVALTGLAVTVVALVQASSGEPRIYGLWRPRHDWAVFGPYVNRNHFAGLIVMAIPLALGLALEALTGLRRAWSRRRWLSIGDAAGNAAVRHFAVSAALVTGLLASRSRGGFVAFVVAAIALPLASRRRAPAVAVAGAAGGVAVLWVGLDAILRGFEMRGLGPSRLVLWSDALRMLPDFPAFGAGFNAFGTAYRPYQTFWPYLFVGEAHNEYLQLLLDTGLAGAAVGAAILAKLFVAAVRGAGRSALGAGIFAALLAECVHNLVEFNWQIPANAATFAAVAGLAVSGSRPQSLADPVPAPAEVGRHRTPEAQGR
jgi:hypothetical protein